MYVVLFFHRWGITSYSTKRSYGISSALSPWSLLALGLDNVHGKRAYELSTRFRKRRLLNWTIILGWCGSCVKVVVASEVLPITVQWLISMATTLRAESFWITLARSTRVFAWSFSFLCSIFTLLNLKDRIWNQKGPLVSLARSLLSKGMHKIHKSK